MRFVRTSTSQPFAALPSQLPKPALQFNWQVDITQTGVALGAGLHTRPQAPQLDTLVVVLTHMPPQNIVGGLQAAAQVPIEQICPAPHARPHMPQFALSICVSTQVPPHKVCPAGQRGRHMPLLQISVAPHLFPQMPQLFVSVSVSTQLPPQAV